MRRTLTALVLALGMVAAPMVPSQAQSTDRSQYRIDIHIIGNQFFWAYANETTRSLPGREHQTVGLMPAGFITTPVAIFPAGEIPGGYWGIRNLTNHDPHPHRITQCGADWDDVDCVALSEEQAYLFVTLEPMQTITYEHDHFPFLGTVYFTDLDRQWMRAAACFEGWHGTGPGPCSNYRA